MDSKGWEDLQSLYRAALEIEAGRREAFLKQACTGDDELLHEVRSLLKYDRPDDSFLEAPALEVEATSMAAHSIPSLIGRQLSHYKIVEKIGSGGMGDVYRAHDSRLGRDVAVKVSAERFSERFEREARVVAALNHANICTLYDVGPNYLVMELIEGPTLADRIQQGPIQEGEALQIAKQIADALEAAHEKGIIHRDLKPGNVKIKPDGTVKVLDFGLATTDPMLTASGESPTFTSAETQSGIIMGTVAYMSPEQAAGKPVDKRSDVWSFGVVLWEVLTGRKLFQGDSLAQTLADVLRNEIDFTKLPETTPAPIRDLVVRCLDRDPKSRLRDLGEARVLLQKYLKDPAAPVAVPVRRRRARLWQAAVVVLVVGAAVAVSMQLYSNRTRTVPGPEQWRQITNFPDSATEPALSRDGRMLAFLRGTGRWFLDKDKQVYVKILPDGLSVQLTHDQLSKMSPAFSPDGSRIAYTVGGFNTWIVSVLAGGEPQLMLPNAEGLSWIDSHRVLFSENAKKGMSVETAMENRAYQRKIYLPNPIGMAHFSSLSPDGKQVLIVEMSGGTRANGPFLPCRLLPFDGNSPGRQVGPARAACTSAVWTPDGKWMYFTADTGKGSHIWRQRVNGGDPEQVTFGPSEQQSLAMAPDGQSLFTSVGTIRSVLWVHDVTGDRQISGEGDPDSPIFSLDGTSVYYPLWSAGGDFTVWVTDLKTGQAKPAFPGVPMTAWHLSGDGKSILYRTPDKSRWVAALDRNSAPARLPIQVGDAIVQLTASGELFFVTPDNGRFYLDAMRLDGSGRHRVLTEPVTSPQISPDEHWVSYLQVPEWKARPMDGGQPRIVCGAQKQEDNSNRAAACIFRWSHDGKTALFIFRALVGGTGSTVAVPLQPGTDLPPLPPGGVTSMEQVAKIPGAVVIPSETADVGPGMSYAYPRVVSQQNIFQIPLR